MYDAPGPVVAGLQIRLLGSLAVTRGGVEQPLPGSRKTRALLGFLALSPRPVRRTRLCDLLFEVPDDPRAALRWSLTKLRPLVDDADVARLRASRDEVAFDGAGAWIDALELRALAMGDLSALTETDLARALDMPQGEFLADCQLSGQTEFNAWLTAMREDFRAIERRLLQEMLRRLEDRPEAQLAFARRAVGLDALDEDAYTTLASVLTRLGRTAEAREVVAMGEQALRADGIVPSPLLRTALTRPEPSKSARAPVAPVAEVPARAAAPTITRGRFAPPSVAVMPFLDTSDPLMPQHLLDGLADGVIHALSRFRSLVVISRLSSFHYRNRDEDPRTIGADLGADYLVGGSITRLPTGFRVRFRTVATATGLMVGSGEVTTATNDAIALQDEIAAEIATLVHPQMVQEAREAVMRRPVVTLEAYEHHLRGVHVAFHDEPKDYAAAVVHFRAAMEAAPDMVAAAAYYGWAVAMAGLARTPEQRAEVLELTRLAISRAAQDAQALAMAAWTLIHLGRDFEGALAAVDRACRINPNERIAWSASGWIRTMAGEYDQPMDHFERAERLNPLGHQLDQSVSGKAMCCLLARRYGEALSHAQRALALSPSSPGANMVQVAAFVGLGAMAKAKSAAEKLNALFPEGLRSPVIGGTPFRLEEDREHVLGALRAAGVPG